MEPQWIAQVEHEQTEVNEQKHERDRISYFRHRGKNWGRRQLAHRGGHEKSGRHAVEQSVPSDGAVPPRHLGHWHVRIASLAPSFLQGRFAERVPWCGVPGHFRISKETAPRAVLR